LKGRLAKTDQEIKKLSSPKFVKNSASSYISGCRRRGLVEEIQSFEFLYSILSEEEQLILNYSDEKGTNRLILREGHYFELDVTQFSGNLRLRKIELKFEIIEGGTHFLRILDQNGNELARTSSVQVVGDGWKEFVLEGSLDLDPYPLLKVEFVSSASDYLFVAEEDTSWCDCEVLKVIPLIRVWSLGRGDERRKLQFNPYTSQIEFVEEPYIPSTSIEPPIYLSSSDSIQEALDSIPCDQGGKIILDSGVYPISSTLEIPCDNISIFGNPGSSIISGSDCFDLLEAKNKKGITIVGVTFVSSDCNCIGDGIVFSGTSFSKVIDCEFYNLGKSGIKLLDCENVTLQRNSAIGNHHFGIIVKNSEYCRLINNVTDRNWSSGVVIQESKRISLFDSCSRSNNDDGVMIWLSEICRVRESYFNFNECGSGVALNNSSIVTLFGNEAYRNSYGFSRVDSTDITEIDNYVHGNLIEDGSEEGGEEEEMAILKFVDIPQSPLISSGESAILEVDSSGDGAEITGITIDGLVGSRWKVEFFLPTISAVSEPSNEDKRNEIIYEPEDPIGGHFPPIGSIRFNFFLKFTNLSTETKQITGGIIGYHSVGSLELEWR